MDWHTFNQQAEKRDARERREQRQVALLMLVLGAVVVALIIAEYAR